MKKICKNMQNMQTKYAKICKKYAKIYKNMQKYTKICKQYARYGDSVI